MVEQRLPNPRVGGSIPSCRASFFRVWCNGNTSASGAEVRGSKPCTRAVAEADLENAPACGAGGLRVRGSSVTPQHPALPASPMSRRVGRAAYCFRLLSERGESHRAFESHTLHCNKVATQPARLFDPGATYKGVETSATTWKVTSDNGVAARLENGGVSKGAWSSILLPSAEVP